jgi:hypothetical protein
MFSGEHGLHRRETNADGWLPRRWLSGGQGNMKQAGLPIPARLATNLTPSRSVSAKSMVASPAVCNG